MKSMTKTSQGQPANDTALVQSASIVTNFQDEGTAVIGANNTVVRKKGVNVGGSVYGPINTGDVIQSPFHDCYQDLNQFLKHNRWLLSLVVTLEIPFALLFFQYKDRFLLSWWLYLPLALLLTVVAWSWVNLAGARFANYSVWRPFVVASVALVVWVSLLGWQIQAALFPPQIPLYQFGIAVATFGEGPDFRVTPNGRQISELLYNQLDESIKNLGLADVIALTRIGIVRDSDQGHIDGARVGAKLVIWGQILEGDDGVVILFQILETENLTDNPSFPQTLPVVRPPLQGRVEIESTNSLAVKQITEPQIVAITAFSLGLYYYFDPSYKLAAKQFEIARENLEKPHEITNVINLGLVYYYLGRSYQLLGEFKDSQKMFGHAAEFSPEDPAIQLGQMYNYRVFGEDELKQQTLEKIINLCKELAKDYVPVLYDCALAYEVMEDDEAALREYKAIIKINPEFFIAYLSAGRILAQLDRFDEAEDMYRKAQDLADGNLTRQAWVYLDTGQLYEKREQNKAAIEAYNRAIELDNTLAMPRFHLAELYSKMGIIDAAVVNYKKLTEMSDNPYWAHSIFADFLCGIGHYNDAIEHYLEALRYGGPYHEPLLRAHLGRAYAAVDEQSMPDKKSRSLNEFELTLQNPGPNEAYIRSNYGSVLFQFGDVDKAISQLERSLELNPEIDIETRLNLGHMYQTIGELEKATILYQSIIEQGDQIPEDRRQIAEKRLKELEG